MPLGQLALYAHNCILFPDSTVPYDFEKPPPGADDESHFSTGFCMWLPITEPTYGKLIIFCNRLVKNRQFEFFIQEAHKCNFHAIYSKSQKRDMLFLLNTLCPFGIIS